MGKKLLSVRNTSLSIALLAMALLATSYCFEYGVGLRPCPLCLLQRYSLMAVGVIFLVAAWHNPRRVGLRIYGIIGLLFAIGGAMAAGRQVWLQHQPLGTIDSCIPGIGYLFSILPAHKALAVIFSSSTNCAEISWQLWGITMPGWSLIFFVVLIVAAVWQIKQA
jgi:disulfide bond formation protein DsbB